MKHANRIAFLVVVMIFSVATQATAQSASAQARLEAYRWGVVAARDRVAQNRDRVEVARNQLDNIEERLDEVLEQLPNADIDKEKYISLVDARRVAAESSLAASEAIISVSEALLAAAEGGGETAFQVAAEAYVAISDVYITASEAYSNIFEIQYDCEPPSCTSGVNFAPSASDLSRAWNSASLAALAAERAKAIVDVLTEGMEEFPPELLEPLPTDLFKTAA